MNRQILFKAKRKDNGEWVEGYYVYCRKRRYILQILNKEIGFDERENLGFYVCERNCVEVIGNIFDNADLLEVER